MSEIFRKIVEDSRKRSEIENEWGKLLKVFLQQDLNTASRSTAKLLILVLLDGENAIFNRPDVIRIVEKLKNLGLTEDLEWIEKFVPNFYKE
ncbi:MAG: hypothetical protein COU27_00145 [Candidatus Levybacteria bacterium CG10_big_fil_rev_8_21_14_0_10_36_7]|nr:MAG: hypothetical protein COU27_00145 [Candidatus Levybacteria bacterium CG10_big_fil_rev_8_21_14_0_10_36_7]